LHHRMQLSSISTPSGQSNVPQYWGFQNRYPSKKSPVTSDRRAINTNPQAVNKIGASISITDGDKVSLQYASIRSQNSDIPDSLLHLKDKIKGPMVLNKKRDIIQITREVQHVITHSEQDSHQTKPT
jgi:hypothetical protein